MQDQFELAAWRAVAKYLADRNAKHSEQAHEALLADWTEYLKGVPVQPTPPTPAPGNVIVATPQDFREKAAALRPGDTLKLEAGIYTSGSTARRDPVLRLETAGDPDAMIKIVGNGDVMLHGYGVTDTLLEVRAPWVSVAGLVFSNARRVAAAIEASDIYVGGCKAYDIRHDDRFIGAAFRTIGRVDNVRFNNCSAWDSNGGFQCRESVSTTGADRITDDVNAGEVYGGAENVTFIDCSAFRCRTRGQHSDGFGVRYGNRINFIGCVAHDCVDDGFDVLGSTNCIMDGCVAFDNGGVGLDGQVGNGNGFKVGVRGGWAHMLTDCLAVDNTRAGFSLDDCERPLMDHCTADSNLYGFGCWTEAALHNGAGMRILNSLFTRHINKGDFGRLGGVVPEDMQNVHVTSNDHNWADDRCTVITELPYDLERQNLLPQPGNDHYAEAVIKQFRARYGSDLGFHK